MLTCHLALLIKVIDFTCHVHPIYAYPSKGLLIQCWKFFKRIFRFIRHVKLTLSLSHESMFNILISHTVTCTMGWFLVFQQQFSHHLSLNNHYKLRTYISLAKWGRELNFFREISNLSRLNNSTLNLRGLFAPHEFAFLPLVARSRVYCNLYPHADVT